MMGLEQASVYASVCPHFQYNISATIGPIAINLNLKHIRLGERLH